MLSPCRASAWKINFINFKCLNYTLSWFLTGSTTSKASWNLTLNVSWPSLPSCWSALAPWRRQEIWLESCINIKLQWVAEKNKKSASWRFGSTGFKLLERVFSMKECLDMLHHQTLPCYPLIVTAWVGWRLRLFPATVSLCNGSNRDGLAPS